MTRLVQMRYDVTRTMLNEKGEVLKDGEAPLTVKLAWEKALLSEFSAVPGQLVPTDEKLRRYRLWLKIAGANGAVELTSEEVGTIRACLPLFVTLVYGQLLDILDGGNA